MKLSPFFRHTVVATTLCCMANSASASDFYFGIGLGSGELDVNTRRLFAGVDANADSIDESVIAGEVMAGLQFENGVLAEIARDDFDSVGFPFAALFLGRLEYGATRVSAGYAPEPAGRFGFVGKLGLSFWGIDAVESPFLNPGDEERVSRDGQSLYLQLGGEFHVTKRWRLGVSYDLADTDVGNARALKLNTRYVFKP
jgi:opacity protein-like surface antigen